MCAPRPPVHGPRNCAVAAEGAPEQAPRAGSQQVRQPGTSRPHGVRVLGAGAGAAARVCHLWIGHRRDAGAGEGGMSVQGHWLGHMHVPGISGSGTGETLVQGRGGCPCRDIGSGTCTCLPSLGRAPESCWCEWPAHQLSAC
eukprot:366490-Chlamydomonas_euryale.AAC.50